MTDGDLCTRNFPEYCWIKRKEEQCSDSRILLVNWQHLGNQRTHYLVAYRSMRYYNQRWWTKTLISDHTETKLLNPRHMKSLKVTESSLFLISANHGLCNTRFSLLPLPIPHAFLQTTHYIVKKPSNENISISPQASPFHLKPPQTSKQSPELPRFPFGGSSLALQKHAILQPNEHAFPIRKVKSGA